MNVASSFTMRGGHRQTTLAWRRHIFWSYDLQLPLRARVNPLRNTHKPSYKLRVPISVVKRFCLQWLISGSMKEDKSFAVHALEAKKTKWLERGRNIRIAQGCPRVQSLARRVHIARS